MTATIRSDTHWVFDEAGRWNLHTPTGSRLAIVTPVAHGKFRARIGNDWLSASPYLDHVPFDSLDAARSAVETALRNEASR